MKLLIRSLVLASASALVLPAAASAAGTVNAEVASSVRAPFEQFVGIYEKKHPGTTFNSKFLGGGVIQGDVESDNPIDLVIVGKNQTDKVTSHINPPVAILTNRETLLVKKGNTKIKDLKQLADPGVKVCMANGQGSAVGTLARTVLKNAAADYGADFPGKVRQNSPASLDTAQSEEDVTKALEAGQCDVAIGFVSSVDPSKFSAIAIPAKYNVDSVYYAFVPKSAKNKQDAEDMIKLMTSTQGQAILHSHRYLPPPKA